MNVLTIVGNLGGDCRTNSVGGQPVCNFSVAMNSGYGDKKQTHWVDCAYWGKGGEAVSQYLTKGQQVYIEGRLQTRRWEDAEGVKHSSVEVVAAEMMMLGERRDTNAGTTSTDEVADDIEDEYPF